MFGVQEDGYYGAVDVRSVSIHHHTFKVAPTWIASGVRLVKHLVVPTCQYMCQLLVMYPNDHHTVCRCLQGKAYLFMPRLPESFAVWFGSIPGPQDVKETYAVDYVHYVDELPAVLGGLDPQALHLLHGTNSDSGRATKEAGFEGIDEFTLETDVLFDIMNECRAVSCRRGCALLDAGTGAIIAPMHC